ncbi:AI-2E family transporter [Paenibacillus physcomitrellae]|uniref:AI-2E family transporter n=1 Tax=Paenibacillus physcomitrellae TaxID=1619311 RepID=A0ABQ1GQC8_9BACL|nr:AI-2E family transporter [Paenibacillus physcomitrellae]GGA48095.1 AI-2E family transporter [Paenibacillus physcomitrellae]
MPQNTFFKTSLGIVMVLTIVFLLHKINFVFNPVVTLVSILIVPVSVSVFLYYLLRPLIHLLDKRKVNRVASVLVIYLAICLLLTIFFLVVWPPLRNQIQQFINNVPFLIDGLTNQMNEIQKSKYFSMFDSDNAQFTSKITEYTNELLQTISGYLSHFISFLSGFFIVVGTVPIVLYYMLKEDGKMSAALVRMIPSKYRKDAKYVTDEIDNALSGFIAGRIISSFLLGVLSFIGYLIIGLPYPLLLAIICAIFNFIPYFGPLLGAIPCVIVAFTESPSMVLWVIVVVFVAQQIEGNLIAPYVYGRTINIHPLTTVVLILIAGEISGILGMLLAIPLYMIVKVTIVRVYRIFLADKVEEFVD